MSMPNIGEATRRLNPQIFGTTGSVQRGCAESLLAETATVRKKRIRQKCGDGMNKTERAFLAYLQAHYGTACTIHREVSLPLANGVRYKVDFMTGMPNKDDDSAIVRAYEVKGYARDDAIVKLKVAATLYPWIRFLLVTKLKSGSEVGWSFESVKP